MKTFLLGIVIVAACISINAQPQMRAIMLKNKMGYNEGDTIQIRGYFSRNSNRPNKYVVTAKSGTTRLIDPSIVRRIDTIQNFWDYQWFLNRSGKVAKSGHYMGVRNILNNECAAYVEQLKAANLLENNPETQDYLDNLLRRIGPSELIKGTSASLKVYVVKSETEDIFSFDNGSIFITTGLLANTFTEEELVRRLTREISHIVNDDQVVNQRNRNVGAAVGVGILAVALVAVLVASSNEEDHHHHNGYNHYSNHEFHSNWFFDGFFYESYCNYPPPIKAYFRPVVIRDYHADQNEMAKNASNAYLTGEYKETSPLSDKEYMRNISGIITYEAWSKYFKSDYKEALHLISRLESNDLAGSDDYLLKAKIYRKLYATDESKYEALRYIQTAKDMKSDINIELLKEEGLIYYQLKDMPKAHASFEEYRYALDKIGVDNEDDRREVTWANQMLEKTDIPN